MTRGIFVLSSGAFYGLLCVFSVVTGLMYLRSGNVVNPLELPQSIAARMGDPDYMRRVSVFFGCLTIVVGLVQGLTAYSLLAGASSWCYWLALGFTIFSIVSAGTKLITSFNLFPLLKSVAYVAILAVLLLPRTRALFS